MILNAVGDAVSSSSENSRPPMTSNRISDAASTVAERGPPSTRLISPKKSPGPSRTVRHRPTVDGGLPLNDDYKLRAMLTGGGQPPTIAMTPFPS